MTKCKSCKNEMGSGEDSIEYGDGYCVTCYDPSKEGDEFDYQRR